MSDRSIAVIYHGMSLTVLYFPSWRRTTIMKHSTIAAIFPFGDVFSRECLLYCFNNIKLALNINK